jgi:hypothetical protein
LELVKKGDEGKRGEYEGLKVEKGKVVAELKEKEQTLEVSLIQSMGRGDADMIGHGC